MKPEKKTCPICGRAFIDKHIWETNTTYCNFLCANYATELKKGEKPSIPIKELLHYARKDLL